MYEPILTDFSGLGPYRWAFAIPLMFGSFIPISRMYLGVHSADQIVIGLTLSFTFLIMYKFFLQKYILRFLNYCVFAKTSKIPLVFITIVCNLIIFAIPLIIYHVNTTTNKVDQQVIDSVNKACNLSGSHLLNHEKIEMAHTMSGMVGSALFGAIYGLMMASCIGSRSSWSHYYFGFWAYRKKRNVVFKILIYIVLGFLTAGIFIIIIPHYVKNVYGRYVSASFGCVTAGMIVSFLTPYLALKGKIITIEEEQNEIIESPKSEK